MEQQQLQMADEEIDLSIIDGYAKIDHAGTAPVAMVMPVPMESTFSTSNPMTGTSIETLRQQGFPLGLAQELGNTKATYPIRFWVVDNSG